MASLTPDDLTNVLSDTTRLRILMLLTKVEELCVCQLTETLDMVQPKISRHLAIMRQKQIVMDRRDGLWVHYRLHPELPTWCYKALLALSAGCELVEPYKGDMEKLQSKSASNCC
jgi:ArsR family transcriptional regulator